VNPSRRGAGRLLRRLLIACAAVFVLAVIGWALAMSTVTDDPTDPPSVGVTR